MNTFADRLYWKMPYTLRRYLYCVRHPVEYYKYQMLRTDLPERASARSLVPFIENRCIFIHIPKAAGIAVGEGLFGRHTGNHATIAEYQIAFSSREFRQFFKFTFVRNPWDRLLSAFLFLKKGGRNPKDLRWAEVHLQPFATFEDFVMNWVTPENIRKRVHFRPQHTFIVVPRQQVACVDFVGYFENIAADYNYIRKKLHIGKDLCVKNRTAEKKRDYRSLYTDRMAQIVANVYHTDIQMLGYDFDNARLSDMLAKRNSGGVFALDSSC